MEESKSVPGARKVRKQSSGGRSGRSSRKSSHSSIASLTDNEIPDTEITGSENLQPAKKIIPNGTHSDEDQTAEQNGKEEVDNTVPKTSEEKESDTGADITNNQDEGNKNTEDINIKTANDSTLNINESPAQDTQGIESSDSGKTTENLENTNDNEKELSVNESDKESDTVQADHEEKNADSLGDNEQEKNNETTEIDIKESVKENKEKVLSTEIKDKKKDRRNSAFDKKDNKKTDCEETDKFNDREHLCKGSEDKEKNLTENKSSVDESEKIAIDTKDKQNKLSHLKEQSDCEVEEEAIVKESVINNVEEVQDIDAKKETRLKPESSDIERDKSESESSDDESNVKLNFLGFETPSREKLTMFFRILEDIRIDDSIMEEMAEGDGDSESDKRDDVNRDDILSTTSSTPSLSSIKSSGSVPRKRQRDRSVKKLPVDLSHPQYLKPFEYGWKRELVFRSVSETGTSKRNADIYYYTPKGKKVRSTREVIENLTEPELTIDNFTFFKEPIGVNDPEKEIIREAKIRGDKDFIAATPPPSKKPSLPKVPKVGDGKTLKAAPMEVDSPVQEQIQNEVKKSEDLSPPKGSAGSLSTTPKIVLKGGKGAVKSKSSAKPLFTHPGKSTGSSKDKHHPDSEDELEMGMLPPLWPTPPEKGTAREISSSTKSKLQSWKSSEKLYNFYLP